MDIRYGSLYDGFQKPPSKEFKRTLILLFLLMVVKDRQAQGGASVAQGLAQAPFDVVVPSVWTISRRVLAPPPALPCTGGQLVVMNIGVSLCSHGLLLWLVPLSLVSVYGAHHSTFFFHLRGGNFWRRIGASSAQARRKRGASKNCEDGLRPPRLQWKSLSFSLWTILECPGPRRSTCRPYDPTARSAVMGPSVPFRFLVPARLNTGAPPDTVVFEGMSCR